MIQEDQDHHMCMYGNGGSETSIIRSSSSSSPSSSSKKLKLTKVPQRGLGVAQLERIRIEQQQNNVTKCSPPPQLDSIPRSPTCPQLPPPPPPPPPTPRPLMPSKFPLASPSFRAHSVPSAVEYQMGSLHPLLNPPTSTGEFSIFGWPSVSANESVNLPKVWHEFHNDHKGDNSSFLHGLSLPYETCPITPLPNGYPKPQFYHHQYQPSSFPMVNNNISSTNVTTSSCSFVPKFPMELPPNQNYFSNYSPLWPDDPKYR